MDFDIVLDQLAFQGAVRGLLGLGSNGQLRADLDLRTLVDGQELACRHWLPAASVTAEERAAGWLMLGGADSHLESRTAQLRQVSRLSAAPQLLIVVNPLREDELQLPLFVDGHFQAVRSLRLIGPGLFYFPVRSGEKSLRRAARHSRVDGALGAIAGRMGRLDLAVVGAGAGGSELARQLAQLGPRSMTLIDPQNAAVENLDLLGAPERDAQRAVKKVVSLAHRLFQNNSKLQVIGLPLRIQEPAVVRHLQRRRLDVLCSWPDNDAATLAASLLAKSMSCLHLAVGSWIPPGDAAPVVARADIRLLEPGRGCCFCTPPPEELDEAIYDLRRPADALRRGRLSRWEQERAGSLGHLNALAAALAVNGLLRYLRGEIRTSHWVRVQWPAGGLPQITEAPVAASEQCRYCRR